MSFARSVDLFVQGDMPCRLSKFVAEVQDRLGNRSCYPHEVRGLVFGCPRPISTASLVDKVPLVPCSMRRPTVKGYLGT